MSILFLNGPPFSSAFWQQVQQRFQHHGVQTYTLDFLHQANTIHTAADEILSFVQQNNIQNIVAHGFAVPAAAQAASKTTFHHVFLSNGPLSRKPQWIPWIHQIPSFAMRQSLRPTYSLPFLASSIAFRRLVVNPYVMERDTIDALCKNNLSSPKYRKNTVSYLHSLHDFHLPPSLQSSQCTLIWGDADPLFPVANLIPITSKKSMLSTIQIKGGQHFHPLERPWAIADAVYDTISL